MQKSMFMMTEAKIKDDQAEIQYQQLQREKI